MKKIIFVIMLLLTTPCWADIESGLIGYWALDAASGTIAKDSSGQANQGTLSNGPIWTTESKVGANALQFDGVDDRVSLGSMSALYGASQATWSFWIKPKVLNASSAFISNFVTNNGSITPWSIGTGYGGANNICVNMNMNLPDMDNAIGLAYTSSNWLQINNWYHLTVVYDGTQSSANRLKLYVNGRQEPLKSQGIPTSLSSNGSSAGIGATSNSKNFFNGIIDDVRIYNRALSAQEALDLYNFRSVPDTTSPSVPKNLVSSNIQPDQVTLSWDVATDSGEGKVDGYKIYRSGILVGSSTTTTYTDTTVSPSTQYLYTVSAYDDALPNANESSPSAALNIRTADADLTAPVISNINVSVFSTLATITWTTDEDSDTQIEYGTTTNYGMQTTLDAALLKEHSKMITGLLPETTYHFRVKSKDGSPAQNLRVSEDQIFTTSKFVGPTANDITEAGEACDGTDLNGMTCTSVAAGFTGGTLKCRSDRRGYDFSGCLAEGRVLKAASCRESDIQAAIDAAQDGDTVEVPSGTCTWTNPVSISKSVILKGAGIDQTNIIENLTSSSALNITLKQDKPVRVTGFTFNGSKTADNQASIKIGGPPGEPLFRVDHCKFTHVTERGIIVGTAYGVIDHNIFLRIPVGYTTTLISVVGDTASWSRPQDQGTAHGVYMEDNTLIQNWQANGPFDMYDGARYMFRYNQLYGNGMGHHGYDSGSSGIVNAEIYENKLLNGLPKDSSYFRMYAHVAKADFAAADPAQGAAKVAALLSRGVLEELPEDTSRVRLKDIHAPRPSELTTPAHVYNRIWGLLNGRFVHGMVFEFRSGSGLLFNNTMLGPMDPTTRDVGYFDSFAMLRNYRSSDGYVVNMGAAIPWNGSPWNGVCDGTSSFRIRVLARGLAYKVGDVLNLIQEGASGATVTVQSIDAAGGITGFSLMSPGKGYRQTSAGVPVTGGQGVRALFAIGMDGNTPGMKGYPCQDQLGRSSEQSLSPVYSWNNNYQGNVGGHLFVSGYATFQCQKGSTLVSKVDKPNPGEPYSWVCTDPKGGPNHTLYDYNPIHIVEGRDYFNGVPKPGYVPYVYPHPLAQMDAPEIQGGSGDISGDGKVTMYDAALVLRYTLGSNLSDVQKQKADVNSDGKIDGSDVLAIGREALGL